MMGVHSGLTRVDWEMDWGAMDMMISPKMLEGIRISQHFQKVVTGHNIHIPSVKIRGRQTDRLSQSLEKSSGHRVTLL